jgi:YD repeat-containing protein
LGKKVFYQAMLSCLLVAGQASADESPVFLPTVAVREAAIDGEKQKIEYAYDEFGHVVSEKWSRNVNGTYVPDRETINEYHRLPSGDFVQTKSEYSGNDLSGGYRYTAAYDSKGMELFHRYEYYTSGRWETDRHVEAVVDGNGIRTAIRRLNRETGKMETDPACTFDNRGRVTQVTDSEGTYTFTWNDEDRLTGFSTPEEGAFHNVVIVTNSKYFNPYELNPLSRRVNDNTGDYAWDDYRMHEWLFSADGDVLTVRATTDPARGEATQTFFAGDVEIVKTVFRTGVNGGYSISETSLSDGGTYTDKWEREYDEHGAPVRDYEVEDDTGDGFHREDETVYGRKYDTGGRPVQTVCTRNGEVQYTETYEAWTEVTPSGNEARPALPAVQVYPNPAVDVIVIDRVPAGSTLAVFDPSGRVIYRQTKPGSRETVSVASWPKGLYFVTIQTPKGVITHKTVKK